MAIKQPASEWARVTTVFIPFAAAYFFSFMLRNINAVVFPELVATFSLGPDALGILTSAYFFAFAAFQIPLGLLLDRFGPRGVNGALVIVAALGAALFALAPNFAVLTLARALMGLGFCGCLMSSMMAFVLWYPRARMATLSGWMLAIGAVGAVVATAPVEFALRRIDWRTLFMALAALILAASVLIILRAPRQVNAEIPPDGRAQFEGLIRIVRDRWFWRIALLAASTQAAALSLLGLWAGPWLRDIAELSRADIAQHLLAAALAFGAGGILFGTLSDRLALRGIAPFTTFLAGSVATAVLLIPFALGIAWEPLLIWSVFMACAASGTLAYPLLCARFPIEMTGRVLTAVNVLTMACAFALQSGMGAVIGIWPAVDGSYAPAGYRAAFGMILGLQCLMLVWATCARTSAEPASR